MFGFSKAKEKVVDNKVDTEFDFDDGLDMEDFDFDLDPTKDDRTPIEKIKDGAVSGIQSGIADTNYLEQVTKEIFPPGIGKTIDAGKAFTENASKLYDDTLKEVKPAIKDFKKLSTKLIPEQSGFVPKVILDKINEWRAEPKDEEYQTTALNAESQRESFLQLQMAEMFGLEQKQRAQDQDKDNLQSAIDMSRHKDQMGAQAEIVQSTAAVDQFNRTVTLTYQKKMVELGYRQLFALQDALKFQKTQTELQGQTLPAMVKNTGLPEFVKQQKAEFLAEYNARKMAETIGESLFGGARNFIGNALENVRKNITGKVTGAVQGFREGMQGGEFALDQTQGANIDGTEFGSNMAASTGAQWLGRKLGGKLKSGVIDKSETIQNAALALENIVDTSGARVKQWKNTNQDYGDGFWGTVKGLMSDGVKSLITTDNPNLSLKDNSIVDPDAPQHFTKRDIRSISDIIPGYLARILREIQIFRTGDTGIGLTLYDHMSGKFADKSTIAKKILDKVVDQSSVFSAHNAANASIGQTGAKNLSPEALEVLKRVLMTSASKSGLGDAQDLLDQSKYVGTGAQEAFEHMAEFFKTSDAQQRHFLQTGQQKITDGVRSNKGDIEKFRSLGYDEILQDLGIIDPKTNAIDPDKFMEYILQKGKEQYKFNPDWNKSYRQFSKPEGGFVEDKLRSFDPKIDSTLTRVNDKFKSVYGGIQSRQDYRDRWDNDDTSHWGKEDYARVWNKAKEGVSTKAGEVAAQTKAKFEEIQAAVSPDNLKAKASTLKDSVQTKKEQAKKQYADFSYQWKSEGALPTMKQYGSQASTSTTEKLQQKLDKISAKLDATTAQVAAEFKASQINQSTTQLPDAAVTDGIVDRIYSNKDSNPSDDSGALGKPMEPGPQSWWKTPDDTAQPSTQVEVESKSAQSVAPEMSAEFWSKLEQTLSGGIGGKFDKLTQETTQVRMAIDKMSEMAQVGQSEEVLKILERIESKVSSEQTLQRVSDILEGLIAHIAQGKNTPEIKKSLKDRAVAGLKKFGSVGGLFGFGASQLTKVATNSAVGAAKGLGWLFKKSVNANVAGLKATARGISSAVGAYTSMVFDVFVEGESEARLLAKDIRSGKYFKVSNGKPLKSHKDIDGPIEDSQGNIIIDKTELKKLFSRTPGKLTKNFLWKTGSLAANLAKGIWNVQSAAFGLVGKIAPAIIRAPWETLKAIGRIVGNILDQPLDVYVPGYKDPILYASIMRKGGYVSKTSGRPITRPSQIDGPVLGVDGEVLTMEMFQKGLFDKYGKKIKTPLAKIGAMIGGTAKAIWNAHKWAAGKALDMTKALWGGVGTVAKSIFGGFSLEMGTKKTVTVLTEIRDYLKNRFGKPKGVLGDMDGDGVRENSWQDIMRKKALKTKETIKDKFASVKDKFTKDKKPDTPDTSGITSLFGKLGSMVGGLKDLFTAGKGATGILGKLGGLLSKLLKIGSLGTMVATAGTGIVGALGAGASAIGGLFTGGAAAAGAMASGAVSTIGAIGGGLLGFLSSPVVLSAAAIGLVGYAGYKAYKYFKGKMHPVDKIRLAQYGYKVEDTDAFSQVKELEGYLLQHTFFKNGEIGIKNENLDLKKLLKPFGIDMNNRQDLQKFMTWFQTRFKPVYLTHCAIMGLMTGKPDLSKVSGLKEQELATYIDKTKFDDGPYSVTELATNVAGAKATDAPYVKSVVASVIKELKLEKVKPSALTNLKTATGAAVTQLPDSGEADPDQPDQPKSKTTSSLAPGLGIAGLTDTSSEDAEGDTDIPEDKSAADAVRSNESNLPPAQRSKVDVAKILTEQEKEKLKALRAEQNFFTGAIANLSSVKVSGKLTAVDAIRMRLYGLKDLDRNKVETILKTEDIAAKYFTTFIAGDPSKFQWKGNVDSLCNEVRGFYGVVSATGKDADSLKSWLLKRFLPIFTSYALMWIAFSKKQSYSRIEVQIKPSLLLEMGGILAGSHSNAWSMTDSPWPKFILNSDPTTIEENMQFLRDLAEKQKILEEKATKAQVQADKIAGVDTTAKPKTETTPVKKISSGDNKFVPQGMGEDGKAPTATATASPIDVKTNPGQLKLADGDILDGRNGFNLIELGKGQSLKGINPQMLTQLFGMAEEYYQLTGKKLQINSGFRSFAQQEAAYKADPSKAAKPGSSQHEFGLAVDAQSEHLDKADKLGLMRKYGFTRPVGGEPWHMEPIGIQSDYKGYRNAGERASEAIKAGLKRGGGGLGSFGKGKPVVRSAEMSAKIMGDNITANVKTSGIKTSLPQLPADAPATQLGQRVDADTKATKVQAALTQAKSGGSPTGTPPNGGEEGKEPRTPMVGINMRVKGQNPPASQGPALGATEESRTANPQIKLPKYDGSIGSVRGIVRAAAQKVGVNPDTAEQVVAVESGFNPKSKAKGTSAKGLGQFVDDTWVETVKKYGGQYGMTLTGADPYDPQQNALMTAHYLKANETELKKTGKKEITATDQYFTHFMGPTGGTNFVKQYVRDPNVPSTQVASSSQVSKNAAIFGSQSSPRQVGEVYSLLDERVRTKAKQFGAKAPNAPISTETTKPVRSADRLVETASVVGTKPTKATVDRQTDTEPAKSDFTPKVRDFGFGQPQPKTEPNLIRVSQTSDPVENAFGFSPSAVRESKVTQPVSPGTYFKPTEDLLKQALVHQESAAKTLLEIYKLMKESKSTKAPTTPTEKTESKTPPVQNSTGRRNATKTVGIDSMPISMKRLA